MGNRTRITIDIETAGIEDAINDAMSVIASKVGMPPGSVLMAPGFWSNVYKPNPEFGELPWADMSKLTKREYRVATIHSFLLKLNVLKNMQEEDHEIFKDKTIKRLKRARWSQYGKRKKVQSSP